MKQRTLRLIVRCCFLAIAVMLLLPILPWPTAAMIVPAASPLVMICSTIATRSLGLVALVGLPVLIAALVRRRLFCRWVCPLGLLVDGVERVRAGQEIAVRFGKGTVPFSLRKNWDSPPVVSVDGAERSRASRKSAVAAWPSVGRWIVLATLAGACFGYPLLLCLDPLGMLTGCVGILGRPLNWANLIPALGVPTVLILSVLLPGAWCRRTCPLGAVQDLLAMPRHGMLRRRIAAEGQAPPGRSPGRSFGIERRLLARRSILAAGLGAASAVLIARRLRTGRERPLRPPGAVEESRFTGICIRCGNCVRACPTRIIQPDPGRHGIAGLLAPVLDFGNDYCKADCNRCTQVCPSGAIARLALADKQAARIGLAEVDMDACIVNEATCSLCIDICPYDAIRSRWDEESYRAVIEVEAAKCPGCGACETVCPAEPKKAIVVEPR